MKVQSTLSAAYRFPLSTFHLLLLFLILFSTSAWTLDCGDVVQRREKIDLILKTEMQSYRVPGAAILIVAGDQICDIRGFGAANLEKNVAVSPNTLFGISSLSKTFTAAAIVDLFLIGRLSQARNAADFFPVSIQEDPKKGKVTIANLLTHTSGFDDSTIGISARTPQDLVPLQQYMIESLPPRVRPSGRVASYSNHGFALAGGILEKVTSRPFAKHVSDRLFIPAGMKRSSFEQPLPPGLISAVATAYFWNGAQQEPLHRIYFNDFPASGMFTSASDMSQFLISLFGAEKKMDTDFPSIWNEIQQQRFTNHPRLPGLTFGFSERYHNGIRFLYQGGDWQDYSSFLAIQPDSKFSLFMAFNSADGTPVAEKILQLFTVGPKSEPIVPSEGTNSGLEIFEGTFRYNRYSRTTMAKIGVLVGAIPEVKVVAIADGLQCFRSKWVPLKQDLLFRNEQTGKRIGFRKEEGRITHLFREENPYSAYERVEWYQSAPFHRALFLILFFTFILSLLILTLKKEKGPVIQALRLTLAANLIYVILLAGVFAAIDPWEFQYGAPAVVRFILIASFLLPVLTAISSYRTIRFVMEKQNTVQLRAFYTIVCLASILFLLLLYEWHLLGTT